MGYFEDLSDLSEYEAVICSKCVNYDGGACPILDLHSMWDDEPLDVRKQALDHFIPRSTGGIGGNGTCSMYLELSDVG
jgi:hypothetical protein